MRCADNSGSDNEWWQNAFSYWSLITDHSEDELVIGASDSSVASGRKENKVETAVVYNSQK